MNSKETREMLRDTLEDFVQPPHHRPNYMAHVEIDLGDSRCPESHSAGVESNIE